MAYLWLKAFHIIGVVAWFAGLFYLVRLFVYHVEAAERPELERAVLQPQFALMERRLYRIITRPAMVLTLATAAGMRALQPAWRRDWWWWLTTHPRACRFPRRRLSHAHSRSCACVWSRSSATWKSSTIDASA